MTKHELIDISKDKLIEMVIKIAESYGASISETSDLDCQLSDLPVITEKEIINSYLKKLKEKVQYTPKLYPYTDHIDSYIKTDEVLSLINNLLTEKGAEK